MKICIVCHKSLPPTDFYRKSGHKDGLRGNCKSCWNTQARAYARTPKGQQVQRKANIKRYGLTLETYEAMLVRQGGLCANKGCGREAKVVDHCHTKGHTRGIMCSQCNAALGLVAECPIRIAGLIEYLSKYQEVPT